MFKETVLCGQVRLGLVVDGEEGGGGGGGGGLLRCEGKVSGVPRWVVGRHCME